jgi:hypothetical protein
MRCWPAPAADHCAPICPITGSQRPADESTEAGWTHCTPRGRGSGIADLSGVPFDGSALLAGLRAAVDFASYWREPDAEDQGFAGEAAREALRPVADAVAVAAAGLPGVRWWTEAVDGSRQRYAQFLDHHSCRSQC